jgi:mono/diheme cytochrome c family protein
MPPVLNPFLRRGQLITGAVTLLAGGALLSGCGGGEPDTVRGRQLFIQNCGTCHALAQAGTSAAIGPDLDAAFAQARADGMTDSTIEGVVEKQIAHPREIEEGTPDYSRVYMPANLVTGQDAHDVAAYVGSVAGVPGAAPPPLGTPAEVFAEKCASCHTLTAGAPAGTGPNLADALQGKDAAYIKESIVDPDKVIYQGFQPGIMPGDFEQQIPQKNLDQLVKYILAQVQVQGGGGG